MRSWILAALAVVLLGSLAVRLDGLTDRGMGHTEIYTPNIELPTDYGSPRARLTLAKTVTNSLWEPHPPGWYVLMWFWTKVAGTGLVAIRLPSVVFGVVVVFLTFVLGRLESNRVSALVAAALVGFGGHQILWSQISRPATLLCALGLLSTILLLLAIRGGSRRLAWLYVFAVVAGLSVEHYFWLLLAGQMLFCVVRCRQNPKSAFALFEYQTFAVIAAAPLLTLARFQGGVSYLDSDPLATIANMLGFGFVFEHDGDGPVALVDKLKAMLAAFGGTLALIGLVRPSVPRGTTRQDVEPMSGPPMGLVATLSAISCGAVLTAATFLAATKPAARISLLATVVVPPTGFAVAYLLKRHGKRLQALVNRVWPFRSDQVDSPRVIVVTLVAPLVLAAAISQVMPLLASRHLLMLVPFLLLLTADGILSLGSLKPRPLAIAAVAVCVAGIVGAYALGFQYQSTARLGPHDYRGLAAVLAPRIEPADVILVRDHFRTTPLFYYMPPSRFDFVGLDHVAEVRRRQPRRVWVFNMASVPGEPAIPVAAVAGYRLVGNASAHNLRADLYERDGAELPLR